MKKINQRFLSTLVLLFVTVAAFADEPNPSEPPEDVPGAPIDSYVWVLLIFGVILSFKIYNSKKPSNKIT